MTKRLNKRPAKPAANTGVGDELHQTAGDGQAR
jgi:hypothetical protein